jgi:hypothetical protein
MSQKPHFRTILSSLIPLKIQNPEKIHFYYFNNYAFFGFRQYSKLNLQFIISNRKFDFQSGG